jgi:hypothetical protein
MQKCWFARGYVELYPVRVAPGRLGPSGGALVAPRPIRPLVGWSAAAREQEERTAREGNSGGDKKAESEFAVKLGVGNQRFSETWGKPLFRSGSIFLIFASRKYCKGPERRKNSHRLVIAG